MEEFKKLEISDEMIAKCKEWASNKNFIDCDTHGQQVEATSANNCVLCRKEKENMTNEAKVFTRLQDIALVPLRYRDSTLDNYYPCDKALEFYKHVQRYDYKQNMLFIGNTGCGKTHLACALLNQALRKGLSGIYVPFYRATQYKIHNYQDKFNRMINCDFLILDEFGVQDTVFKKDLLQEIIDERYLSSTAENFKATVIISNLKLSPTDTERLKAQVDGIELKGYFVDSVSDATKSRLKESFKWFDKIDWEDYRIKKGTNNV